MVEFHFWYERGYLRDMESRRALAEANWACTVRGGYGAMGLWGYA